MLTAISNHTGYVKKISVDECDGYLGGELRSQQPETIQFM